MKSCPSMNGLRTKTVRRCAPKRLLWWSARFMRGGSQGWWKDLSWKPPLNADVYFVLTCGGDVGLAGKYAKKLCAKKGLAYHGLMGIRMPENYIAMYQAPCKEEAREIIRRAKEPIQHACSLIGGKKEFPEQESTLANVLKSGMVNDLFYPLFVTAKGYHTTSACIGCGKCAALCPLNNIRMEGKQPVWGNECTQCMACICGCPAKAVEYRKKTHGKERYYLEG